MKWKCNLCPMDFDDAEELIDERKQRHVEWHEHCKVQKRNTTEGKVMWEVAQ